MNFTECISTRRIMKSVLITGAAGNLGRATVERLERDGYRLHAALSPDGEAGVFGLPRPSLQTYQVDLSDAVATGRFVAGVLQREPDLEAAVLLVGGWAAGPLSETTWENVDKMLRLNVATALNVVHPLLAHFERRGGGHFIFVGARAALRPKDGKNQVGYALAKSLVFDLAAIVNEYGRDKHIRASVIAPSTLDTPQNRASMPQADPAKWVPLDEAAGAIAFLLDEDGPARNFRETVVKLYNEA
jgi:NAD(P)-dependent dehydrogenase (short-subunit alcohol dehydrogenase family)